MVFLISLFSYQLMICHECFLFVFMLLFEAASDDESREALLSSYNLTGTLASVIHCNSATPREPVVLQVTHECEHTHIHFFDTQM